MWKALDTVDFGPSTGLGIDAAELTYCDSTGISVFIVACKRAQAAGSSFGLAGFNLELMRLFRVYDLMDVDGDGRITRVEHVRMMASAFRLSEEAGSTAFDRLDLDGNGTLSRDELHAASEQFFRSADENAKGNWVFGPIAV